MVGFVVNDSLIDPYATDVIDQANCRRWMTLRIGWERGEEVLLMPRCTLAKPFNDGKATYAAGVYEHRIAVHAG
jgi:hypothetical protein